jgi:hypothetical protein
MNETVNAKAAAKPTYHGPRDLTSAEIEDLRRDAREGHEFCKKAFADIKPFK